MLLTLNLVKYSLLKGVVHLNVLTPIPIQDVHVFLSSVEKKLRFLILDFPHIMDFNGNQTVQGPNESFSAAL